MITICDVCGHKDFVPVATRADGMQVFECLQCGLAFISQLPEAEFLESLYGESYFRKEIGDGTGYQSYGWNKVFDIQAIFGTVIEIISKHHLLKGARVLEVGCATGELLFLAREAGASVVGLERSEWAAEEARRRFNLEIINGTLEEAPLTPNSFDVVVSLEVIEHTLSPQLFMKTLASMVRPGGLVIMSTPNYRMAKILGDRWVGFRMSFEHLYFLSDEVLMRLGRRFGLSTVEWYGRGSGIMPAEPIKPIAKLRKAVKKIPGAYGAYALLLRIGLLRTRHRFYWERFGQGHEVLVVYSKRGP